MRAPTHIALGVLSAIGVSRALEIPLSLSSLLLVGIGSLLPDIDTDGMIARPGQLLKKFLPNNMIVTIFDGLGLAISAPFRAFSRHRGVTHWPILAFIAMSFAIMLDQRPLFFFSVSYLSHIFSDAITDGGVPLFAPWTTRSIPTLKLRTGSVFEHALGSVLLVACVVYGYRLLPPQTRQGFEILQSVFRFTRSGAMSASQDQPKTL